VAFIGHFAVGERMNILLALSTSRYSAHLVKRALAEVAIVEEKNDVVLHVLYVIESDELNAVSHKVGGDGFLGTSIQQDVLAALQEEHHRMAMLRIEEVQIVAKEKNYNVKVTEVSGNFSKEVIAYADKESCDVIFLTRDDRPFISRFLFGSEADRVARLAKKEGLGRVIIDED
jgi:nucleotide-binding universal stress UspA family protein